MARIKGPKKTNRYPDDFKIKAVQLADHPDILAKDVAEDLGIHPILLYRWRKEYREGKFKEDKDLKRRAFDIIMKQYSGELFEYEDALLKSAVIIKVEIQSMSGKKSDI